MIFLKIPLITPLETEKKPDFFQNTANDLAIASLAVSSCVQLENEIPVAVSLQLNGSKLAICSVTVQPATLVCNNM